MKIGIYGGSFNPVHLGHRRLADCMCKVLELDKCLIVPAFVSPFKTEKKVSVAPEHRLKMCRLAFDSAQYTVCDLEIAAEATSYTVHTVRTLKEQYPDASFYLIVGSDMLLCFDRWFQWREILRLCTLCAVSRCGEDSAEELNAFADAHLRACGEVKIIPFSPLEISSTVLRERLAKGEPCGAFLNHSVEHYIMKNNLYKMYNKELYLADLKNRLDDYRFTHSVNVAAECRILAERYGEDSEKAYYVGLLHDVFKNEKKEDVLAFFEQNGIVLTDCERRCPKLWHAMAGSVYLQQKYGFDADFIHAVRYHTTGRAGMSKLEKIVFVADFISAERDYPGVDEMRERAKVSLEYCMEEGLRFTIDELVNALLPVHPDTIHAFNDIVLFYERRKKSNG